MALALLYRTSVETERDLNKTKSDRDQKASKPSPRSEKSSVRVFIVEDEPTTIILTEAMLSQLGYHAVGVATSYETTMAALKVIAVDIVLVDLVLSGEKSGFEVIKELNRLNIPCILITGTLSDTTLQKLADLDVYGFLPKPYDQLALATAIQLALKKFTRMQDKIFEEADAIKSRILASKALEEEFGFSERFYLIKKENQSQAAHQPEGTSNTYHRWAKVCVTVATVIAVLAAIGYLFSWPVLLAYSSHASTMKINAMLCLFLMSFALWVENEVRLDKIWKWFSLLAITVVFCVSGLSLIQYVSDVDLGIDQLIAADKFANEFNLPGRMAMTTAMCFLFLAIALISNRFKKYRFSINVTEGAALIAIFFELAGVLGHIFRQTEFNQVIPYSSQSRPTLIGLIALTLGVFYLNPKLGLMSIFSNRRTSAKLGRKMLYWINFLMVVISFTIYYFTPQSSFANLEVIFILIATLTILTTIILWATLKFIRNEIQAEQTVKFLQNRERELQFVLKRVPNPVAVLDLEYRYVLASRKWIEDFNLKDKNIIGRSHYEFFPNASEVVRKLYQRAMSGELINTSVENVVDPEGRHVNVKGEIRPWFDINNQVAGIIIFIESITYPAAQDAPVLNQ